MDIKGKKISFLGDSITEGAGTTAPEKRYFEIIAKKTGAICKGYGIGGTRISKNTKPSIEPICDKWFNSRVDELDKDSDIIVVFGGTNDFGHGDAPLGNIDDTAEETFYGALNVLYSNLISKFPTARIIVITPTHRLNENRLINEIGIRNMTNLKGYADIIKEVAKKYSLPVFDFYSKLGITPEIEEQKNLYMPDGLHPSDKGHEKMADLFISEIQTL